MSLEPATLTSKAIEVSEIEIWFQSHRKPWPTPQSCEKLALIMNRLAGHAPPSSAYLKWQAMPWEPIIEEEWWDFKKSSDAVGDLAANLPAMLNYWGKGNQKSPRKLRGFQALQALALALEEAAPYIQKPFGDYAPAVGRKERKAWHIAAIAIYPEVGSIIAKAGHTLPSRVARNSIWVAVTFKALQRLELPDARMMQLTAVASFIDRWATNGGMTAKHITALCSQDTTTA
jgi:hypothetical protein